MKDLKGKIVLITGAGGGIGKATALAFAHEGCDIVICDIDMKKAESAAKEIATTGRRVRAFQTDVSNEEQVKTMAAQTLKEFGRVDIIVCNAGIGWTGATHLMSRQDWDTVFGINFFGVIHFIQNFTPSMVERREGQVVIISSIFGITGLPFGTLYAATKAGLLAVGECLRSELSFHNVGVTTICPGLIATDLTATTRFKGVDEAARDLPSKIPAMSVDRCAAIIVRSVKKNKGVVIITALAKALWAIKRVSQRLFELVSWLIAKQTRVHVKGSS